MFFIDKDFTFNVSVTQSIPISNEKMVSKPIRKLVKND